MYAGKFWNTFFALFFFTFVFLFSFDDFSYYVNASTDPRSALHKLDLNQQVTIESLKLELKRQNIVCSEQVHAQIQIESAHMTSFLFKRTNNLLGMRYPIKRQTSASGIYLPESDTVIIGSQKDLKKYSKQNNYAVYASWKDCVKDYKIWQDEYFKITEKYLSFLGSCYAEDEQYVNKIKVLMKRHNASQ